MEAAGNDWEETLEFFRIMLEEPSNWASTFAASFQRMLAVRERVSALANNKTVFIRLEGRSHKITDDQSTGDKGQALFPENWSPDAGPLLEQRRTFPKGPADEPEWVICVVHSLALGVLAAVRESQWCDERCVVCHRPHECKKLVR